MATTKKATKVAKYANVIDATGEQGVHDLATIYLEGHREQKLSTEKLDGLKADISTALMGVFNQQVQAGNLATNIQVNLASEEARIQYQLATKTSPCPLSHIPTAQKYLGLLKTVRVFDEILDTARLVQELQTFDPVEVRTVLESGVGSLDLNALSVLEEGGSIKLRDEQVIEDTFLAIFSTELSKAQKDDVALQEVVKDLRAILEIKGLVTFKVVVA